MTLDEGRRRRLVRALRQSWDEIADDCFLNDRGEPDLSITLTRAEVAELAADCGRLVTHGCSPTEQDVYYLMSDAARAPVIREAFPDEFYGS